MMMAVKYGRYNGRAFCYLITESEVREYSELGFPRRIKSTYSEDIWYLGPVAEGAD